LHVFRSPFNVAAGNSSGYNYASGRLDHQTYFKAIREGRVSVLLAEQYFEFALKLADQYYVMEKGAIVLRGHRADLDKEAIKPYLAL
jgi:ABC-type branched-subunit amino acid transport system ATPase component